MKREIVILITSSLFLGSFLIFMLNVLSDRPNNRFNDFTRKFPPHLIHQAKALNIKYNSYYIAGTTSSHIFLGNSTAALHLLIANASLADTQHVQLKIKELEKFKFRSIKVMVDSPYFYLTDGTLPAMLRGTITTWEASRFIEEKVYFTSALPISSTSLVLTMISSDSNEKILAKETTYPPYIQLAPSILEKQVDGIFCTDGMLHYTPDLASLVYLYRYRNEFIYMDSSLNVLYRGNTIDSISQAQIKVAEIKSENSITLAKPPLTVNIQSCVAGKWLFVNSNLLGKDESEEMFNKASVIDIYNLTDGIYMFSFYVDDYKGKKMQGFRVLDDKMVALFDHYLLTYRLNTKYFEKNMERG